MGVGDMPASHHFLVGVPLAVLDGSQRPDVLVVLPGLDTATMSGSPRS